EGYLLFARGGEVKASLFDSAILKKVIPYYRKKRLLDERPLHFDLERNRVMQTPLRFPGKIAPTRRAIACSSRTAITIGSSSRGSTASCST
ncbi:MAG TPA: hypothetical protein VGH32_11260, partial [Pirellulales bacterium]